MEKHKVLDQLLMELHRFLLILDKETLSGNATVQKGLLSELLQSYKSSSGADEEYIYMNKVTVGGKEKDNKGNRSALANGKAAQYIPVPQKSLPNLPPPRAGMVSREPFPLPALPSPACIDTSESYYEEAQPYGETFNDDPEAVSSSYESYDEEEVTRGKSPSARHQWPSTEASIELMKDARICAFLWRKKWLGQWSKQLCVIKDHRLLCYKSSKEQAPLLDVSLLGCSVVYKEKHLKRKEHKLKIMPVGGEAIVLALQSKEQTEQWLRVIEEISPKLAENHDPLHPVSDSPRLICTKGELSERHSVASESGSSTDSHAETPENKDVKKKYGAGLKFSNLMNIGKKKPSSLDNSEKCVDTSGYLNVFVNSQWRTCWCLIKDGQLWFYQDKSKNKMSQPAVTLGGCSILPDPSPEHLYSLRIDMDGTQLATLEAKTSADMGHWLGLLLSQTGTKTDPEELTYDYVNAERISSIVSAAKTSFYLMQRRYSEPNTYIDNPPSIAHNSDELYDDVASIADPEDVEVSSLPDIVDNSLEENDDKSTQDSAGAEDKVDSKVYLDLVPVRSFLHTSCGNKTPPAKDISRICPAPVEDQKDSSSQVKELTHQPEQDSSSLSNETNSTPAASKPDQERPLTPTPPQNQPVKTSTQSQDTPKRVSQVVPQASSVSGLQIQKGPTAQAAASFPNSPQPLRPKAHTVGSHSAVEVKLGKNRTEADLLRYIDERDRLEKDREEVKSTLANLKKEKRELREELGACQDPKQQVSLEGRMKQKEEACREAEQRRVEVELRLVEVKESLKKVESGPFTLGTTLDSSLQDTSTPKTTVLPAPLTASPASPASLQSSSNNNNVGADLSSPVNSASALKSRPASIMATKGKVLQKAKEWEKKSTT